MYDLLNKARREGLMALESDVEEPAKSPILSKYPSLRATIITFAIISATPCAWPSAAPKPSIWTSFWNSTWKCTTSSQLPIASLSTMADSLPGLGIVAAVLGVVITMGALGGPPEEIGT